MAGLDLPSKNSIGGTTRAIFFHAEKLGFKPDGVLRRDVKGVRPTKVTRYFAGSALQANEVPES